MYPESEFLGSVDGREVVRLAREVLAAHPGDPLRARRALDVRCPDATPDQARAALAQASLQLRAASRFGTDADDLLWSDAGLAAASRPGCTQRRARRLLAAGVTEVVDLTCGLGLDAIGFAAAGLNVLGVERDDAIADLARRNVAQRGLDDRVTILVGSCQEAVSWEHLPRQAWFVDPARRDPGRVRADGSHIRLDDAERWSPPWSWVKAQIGVPQVLLAKAAPGIEHRLLAQSDDGDESIDTEVEWVSEDGQLLEAAPLWRRQHGAMGCVPRGVRRRAVVLGRSPIELGSGTAAAMIGQEGPAAPPEPGEVLFDPDPAIVRAGLVAELARAIGGRLVDEHLAYLVVPDPLPQSWRAAARRQWRVLWVGGYRPEAMREACVDHGIGQVDVTGRGRSLTEDRVRRDLRLRGRPHLQRRGTVITMGMGPRRSTIAVLGVIVTEA